MNGSASARRIAGVALGAALIAGACSSGQGSTAPSTTVAPATTTARPTGGGTPTRAELATVLPAATDLGEGWVETDAVDAAPSIDDGSPTDRAVADQCPALAGLVGAETDGSADADHVVRRFVDGDGREVAVELDPSARMRTDADLQRAVDAANACDAVVVDDRDGVTSTLSFQAAVDPDHGEQAVKFQARVELALPFEADPISLNLYGMAFRTATVGVRITASDGLDSESLGVNRTDVDLLASLSDRLEASVDDLVG